MPAHSASEDARKRAGVAGIHVFRAASKAWMTSAGMTTAMIRHDRNMI
jgi:hypothetical protein